MNKRFFYAGERLNEISFPLGGIGSGSIGLAGNGRLIDWEIRNRPNKGSVGGFSHFAVKVEDDSSVLDTRVLQGDFNPPYTGSFSKGPNVQFGSGVPREYLTGLPHFQNVNFTGEYPFAKLEFKDEHFPGTVGMTAFNPLIPGNDRDSSIPAAFFELSVRNSSNKKLRYTFAGSLGNPFGVGRNEYRTVRDQKMIYLNGPDIDTGSSEYGNLTIATDAEQVSYQEYWFRGTWFDNVAVYWHDMNTFGPFVNRRYDDVKKPKDLDTCLLAAHLDLEPGAEASARFVISWSYPNAANYWDPVDSGECDSEACCPGGECDSAVWKNYYATLFQDSAASTVYSLENWTRLFDDTRLFKDTLFSSTLPEEVIDAVSANISILKSPTVLRLEDGTFYGFEGCSIRDGCCEGSCTHVWNYAYALPFLFPKLERSMRNADFRHNLDDAGGMRFRLPLPIGRAGSRFRPCADGQFGGIIKMYREWKISGDTEWLRSHWGAIKANLEYAWSESNPDRWDRNRDGVLEGRQHHTLDVELFGPNSWLTGFYLAALAAAAEMAEHLGDGEVAASYRELFERGKSWVDKNLFDGEYYSQKIDLTDQEMLETYAENENLNAAAFYWDDEHSQIKYQIAEGCGIDQVIGQWHANLVGLGEIFDPNQTRSALESIFRYNFKRTMREHSNPCRVYALNDEAALLICSFPKSAPIIAIPYAEEAMNGFEYQAACHMIQEGMVDEGLEIVRAVRDRYDGVRRNPWNEFECGSNYARSMASYSLIIAMSGFEYDMVKQHVGFRPVVDPPFRCFWSLESGWGEVVIDENTIELKVLWGALELKSFRCTPIGDQTSIEVTVGDTRIDTERSGDLIRFGGAVHLASESDLVIRYGN